MLTRLTCLGSSINIKMRQIAIAALSIGLLWLALWPMPAALAQSAPADMDNGAATLTAQERQELEDLRTEKRFKQFIDQRIANSPEIQDRLELEVDRAFARTTTLLNIVLAILTLIPLLAALGVWLLRRSVVSELVSEVRTQLEKEVFTQLKQQKLDAIAEIEQLKKNSLKQVEQMVAEAQTVLDELKTQTAIANQEIELLKSQAASQLETMVTDAQEIKDQTIQELTNLLPVSTTDKLAPEVQPRVGNLTALLEGLKRAIPQISFSANDYLKQGNAFFFESRYDDAVDSYDRAIQLSPELYEAWFTKASTLMLLQRYEEAAQAYQFATQLKPSSYEAWAGQGAALLKAQHYADAIAALNQAIACKPEDYLAFFNRGNAYSSLDQLDLALADYDAALLLKPDFAKAHLQRGKLLQQRGHYKQAISDYEAVLKLDGKDAAEAWYNKGACLALQDEVETALTALENALTAAPGLNAQARVDPSFEAIRTTLRFHALMKEFPQSEN
ncbi:MAG: tetratricopeptide repeat protein [Leptolyngbya sp. SIO1D8]|nr:tetratricopeptide repeat protein [Leptolyngbya sp. SIO1D8]